jgi:hypothetical protein
MRKALDQLPPDLAAAYDSALDRIRSKGPEVEEIALEGLAWVLLVCVSSIDNQRVARGALWRDVGRHPRPLLEFFAGLVVVEHGNVQFVHYTVQERLLARNNTLPSMFYIAKVCLAYTLFDEFDYGPITL